MNPAPPTFVPSLGKWAPGESVRVLLSTGQREYGRIFRIFVDGEGRRNALVRVEPSDLGDTILVRRINGIFQQVNI